MKLASAIRCHLAPIILPTALRQSTRAAVLLGKDMRGGMPITYTLADADGDIDVFAVHHGLPRALSTADNEVGWKLSLA